LDDLRAAGVDDLIAIDGIGEIMAREVISFFQNARNMAVIENLLKHITIKYVVKNTKTTELTDKKIVLTGTLSKYSRDDAREILENMGARVQGSVSAKTDIVLAGADAGSKLKRANELNITIWSEDDFERAIKNAEG
jgi:DNA ligase (NAD+)